jgi:transposase
VRRNQTDARDAAAICAALKHPDMRLVARTSAAPQAARGLERARALLVKQRTQLGNNVRSQLAEHGLVAAQGRRGFAQLAALLADGDARIPAALVPVLRLLLEQIAHLATAIATLEARIVAAARADPAMRRLATIPGVGPIVAHALVAAVGDGRQFRSARDFAAWAGLPPRQHASAGKRRSQGISRHGDRRRRTLCARGASTVLRTARAPAARATAWQHGILARRPVKVAVLAQAAKTARIAWAMLVSGAVYQPQRQARTSAAA